MRVNRPFGKSLTVGLIASALAVTGVVASPPGSASAAPDGSRCIIDRNNAARTMTSLTAGCTSEQIIALFERARAGQLPAPGRYRLTLLPALTGEDGVSDYDFSKSFVELQGKLGDGLTFTTGPQGQPWVYKNYITGRDAGSPVQLVPRSFQDRKPAWGADFTRDFGGLMVSTHEYRQLTPAVWIGRDYLGRGTSSKPPGSAGTLAFTR